MGKAKKCIGSKRFMKRSRKQGKLLVKLLAKLRTQYWNREQFFILSRPSCVRNFHTSVRNFLPETFFELSGQELRTLLQHIKCSFHISRPRPSLFEAQFDLYGGRIAEAQGTLSQLGSN
ncbi:hypothetical protein PIB30_097837, partial [Stylosanthes scabra]|nr:hypothetical protein [Stylosanthes scabra]